MLIMLQPVLVTKNSQGSNHSGKALRQRDTSYTCSAKIVIRLDQYSFHLVCGVGDNHHRGHPPMAPNKITNRKRFLDAPTLENAAAMAAANIWPSQAALFTRSSTGELFKRGQMAYIQGFSRMALDSMDSLVTSHQKVCCDDIIIFCWWVGLFVD